MVQLCNIFFFFLQAIETCVAAAGFSVGEFAALVFSGAMDFAEGTTHQNTFVVSVQDTDDM